MNLRNSKKYIMALAALQILFFHQWIPVFTYGSLPGQIERFIIGTGYIGVDLFFFVSAYSLSLNPINNYSEFIDDRKTKLIPLFLIALIFGHFLWFIPALMVVYLLLPLMVRPAAKLQTHSFLIAIIAWAIITAVLLKYVDKTQMFGIFLFRIPIIILGVFSSKFDKQFPPKNKLLFGILLSFIGIVLTYKFGYLNKLQMPFKDIFYIANIPLSLGIMLLIDEFANYIDVNWIKKIGSISLEMYFVQVVLGSQLVRICFKILNSKIATNIASFLIVIIISAVIAEMYNRFKKLNTP